MQRNREVNLHRLHEAASGTHLTASAAAKHRCKFTSENLQISSTFESKSQVIQTGARSSALSKAQFEEVAKELKSCKLLPVWTSSPGDRDKTSSLRTLDKTDFFTRDLDLLLLKGEIRIAIHSAKDLPDPIHEGLKVIAITKGLDPRDSLVLRGKLEPGMKIATSSKRREEAVKKLCAGLDFIDLRGTIEERLATKDADGVVIAESALIRLKLTHLNRIILDGPTHPMQGKLAIVARENDWQMQEVFNSGFS